MPSQRDPRCSVDTIISPTSCRTGSNATSSRVLAAELDEYLAAGAVPALLRGPGDLGTDLETVDRPLTLSGVDGGAGLLSDAGSTRSCASA